MQFQRNLNPSLRRGTDKDKVAVLIIFLVSTTVHVEYSSGREIAGR